MWGWDLWLLGSRNGNTVLRGLAVQPEAGRFLVSICQAECYEDVQSPFVNWSTMQLDCDLLYRLSCCNEEAPNTVVRQGDVYFSLQNGPEVCSPHLVAALRPSTQLRLWLRELLRFSWSPRH